VGRFWLFALFVACAFAAPEAGAQSSALPADGSAVGVLAHEGSSIARSAGGNRLYIADEPNEVLYVIPTDRVGPGMDRIARRVPLPGAPSQIVVLRSSMVLVTVREPGALVALAPNDASGLEERWRLSVPYDAWGIAISGDESTAIVTSAWSHKATAVDVALHEILWSIDVPREPRGVTIDRDGRRAWIGHLTSGSLTRVDWPPGGAPTTREIASSNATLGWAVVLGRDGRKVFASRQDRSMDLPEAIWVDGSGHVAAISTEDDHAMLPDFGRAWTARIDDDADRNAPIPDLKEQAALAHFTPVPNAPRAMTYGAASDALLVGFSASGELIQLDAAALVPTDFVLGKARIEGCDGLDGIVLSPDESRAWVRCGASFAVAAIDLAHDLEGSAKPIRANAYAKDPLPAFAAAGRRAFENGRALSQGMACAGCHPEGRDDGQVWAETVPFYRTQYHGQGIADLSMVPGAKDAKRPRQTPMLAGRVGASGPYGWRGESATLEARILKGSEIHRWFGRGNLDHEGAPSIAEYLRTGLRVPKPPPHALDAAATAAEARGKTIFEGVGRCGTCHATEPSATNEAPMALAGSKDAYKPPNLRFVGSTAPYYHDGSEATLADLVRNNADRMGVTASLTEADRHALVAYLESL
jgi:cytochrome c peroxidase